MVNSEPIKVLHLISSSGLLGAERVILELATRLKESEVRTTIGVFENSQNPNLELAKSAENLGFKVQIFPCDGRFDKKTVHMIKDYVDKNGVQILHSHNYKSNFYTWRSLSNNRVRWVVTSHGRRFGPRLLLYNLLDTFIVRNADRIAAVSGKIASQMKLAGINKGKIRVIENGINLNRFTEEKAHHSAKQSLGIKQDASIIGTIGSLSREKGHMYLIKAIPQVIGKFSESVFLFVGDGRERVNLERMVSELGIKDKVVFAGMRKDVPEILSLFDVFVLPSLKEGLPMALLEAQASRVPVVASSVGAIPDVVKDGATGILIPPKDPKAIAEAICQILSDKNFAFGMAQRGFERVRDNFSSKKMANKYLSIYKELLEGTGCRAQGVVEQQHSAPQDCST